MLEIPTIEDVLQAKQTISKFVLRTPLTYYSTLSSLLGANIYVKHENYQKFGSFKIRGGVNLVSSLKSKKWLTITTASSGNHGQSIAYAGQLFGLKTIVAVPKQANPDKVKSIQSLNAQVIFYGDKFDDARQHIENIAKIHAYRYIHPANEPLLISGVATTTIEILEDLPDVDYIIVPIGAGSGASGACIVTKALKPSVQVIGVQSEQSQAAYKSWKTGSIQVSENDTNAEGLSTMTGFELPQSILRNNLKDFILVNDDEIEEAIFLYIQQAHTLAEAAGATSLAGTLKIRHHIKGKNVAIILSGGNITVKQLKEILNKFN